MIELILHWIVVIIAISMAVICALSAFILLCVLFLISYWDILEDFKVKAEFKTDKGGVNDKNKRMEE